MAMKAGPNDKCPCGSGIKYKKCCMLADTTSGSVKHSAPVFPSNLGPREPAPLQERPPLPTPEPEPDPLWDAYEAAAPSERIELVTRMLENPEEFDEPLDADLAFEMLSPLHQESCETRERQRFEALIEVLRERRPDIFEEQKGYILDWLLNNAILSGNREAVRELGPQYAAAADTVPELYWNVVESLAFHGFGETLAQMAAVAWLVVSESDDLFPGTVQAFAADAITYITIDHVTRLGANATLDDSLVAKLEEFEGFKTIAVRDWISSLVTGSDRSWTARDLDFPAIEQRVDHAGKRGSGKQDKRREENLQQLCTEWMGWLWREAGFPLTRAFLAGSTVQRYLLSRAYGGLGPRSSMMDQALRPAQVKATLPIPKPAHVLCPDAGTFERVDQLAAGMFAIPTYSSGALAAAIPAWLRFIEDKGLVSAEACHRSCEEVRPVIEQWWARSRCQDSAIADCIEESWRRFGVEAPKRLHAKD